ncbi:MAG TPA: ROK family protein [Bryobacteraceae bacterium]|nr:ROK family protein [Bryobacteraceae bacterium]
MRNLEEALFWEILYRHEAVRSELTRLFDVSTATISRSVGVLLSKRLVIETGATSAYRGRRPNLLQINPQLAYVAGIEIDRDRITAVVTDMLGNLLGRGAVEASPQNSVAKMLRDCRSALKTAVADAGLPMAQLARIGVGHTGMLDVENGICLNWEAVPHWRRVNLIEGLREALGKDVTLDDRARAIALALHLLWPEHRRHRSAIYVQIGTGIGAGIFVNGRMLRGATQAGGEIGHMAIERNGPICACGRRGCLEAFASLGATVARVRRALEAGEKTSLRDMVGPSSALTAEIIACAARQGDVLAKAALNETGEALGIGIVNAVQLLNPSLVVLAGKFANAAREFLLEAVTRAIRRQCFENVSRVLEIRVAPLRKDVGPVGCALLASVDVAASLLQRALFPPPS